MHDSEVRLEFPDDDAFDSARRLLPSARPIVESRRLDIATDDTVSTIRTTLNLLDAADVTVTDVEVHTPTLDDVFFALTGSAPAEPVETDTDTSGAA